MFGNFPLPYIYQYNIIVQLYLVQLYIVFFCSENTYKNINK